VLAVVGEQLLDPLQLQAVLEVQLLALALLLPQVLLRLRADAELPLLLTSAVQLRVPQLVLRLLPMPMLLQLWLHQQQLPSADVYYAAASACQDASGGYLLAPAGASPSAASPAAAAAPSVHGGCPAPPCLLVHVQQLLPLPPGVPPAVSAALARPCAWRAQDLLLDAASATGAEPSVLGVPSPQGQHCWSLTRLRRPPLLLLLPPLVVRGKAKEQAIAVAAAAEVLLHWLLEAVGKSPAACGGGELHLRACGQAYSRHHPRHHRHHHLPSHFHSSILHQLSDKVLAFGAGGSVPASATAAPPPSPDPAPAAPRGAC
jgi:hypothetical protein